MNNVKGFCMFFDWVEDLDFLSGEDAWAIIKIISNYYKNGVDPMKNADDRIKCPLSMMFHQIKRQEEISEINRKNIMKRINKASVGGDDGEKDEAVKPDADVNKNEPLDYERADEAENTNGEAEEGQKEDIEDLTAVKSKKTARYSELFSKFWEEYPRKVGKAKAEVCFIGLKPDGELVDRMISALKSQKNTEQWKKEGGKFIPYPSTWLERGQWEDVVEGGVEESTEDEYDFLGF